jgi:hypothetical protein
MSDTSKQTNNNDCSWRVMLSGGIILFCFPFVFLYDGMSTNDGLRNCMPKLVTDEIDYILHPRIYPNSRSINTMKDD